ncbi:patatin-like phospholipase family protein [Photobacterium sp.]|uniref:patatin-like phospholipase family protein n=1 Tax=Photobacterium sp. TaxID=660 RepID=UPI00299F2FD6|nr:patatin-like phospholipase family protein [Photobacterium sp.]MDX1303110.1 patatin-like phospholipase family protein [Photobacterium sp.]
MSSFERYRMGSCLLLMAVLGQSAWAQPAPEVKVQPERKKIALVLSGGGAKGAAHIGVLEVLESNRIPIDMVTGTSMGAYVGGMYALGLSVKEVKHRTLAADWQSGYEDRVGRNDLMLRRKQQGDDYTLHTDLGVSLDGEFRVRPGAFQGQGMAVLLRSLTENLPALSSFDKLAIPYRSVATDIAQVEPVVIDSGHLATAMQASMTVPGALKPVRWHDKLLVDGGVVNNMPVDVAHSLGANVIIAVDLRDGLLSEDELNSALNIVSQLTTYMTNSSADSQKALMRPGDVYLQPDVSFMMAPDFDQMERAYHAGRDTALKALPTLLQYQLSEPAYDAYVKEKLNRRSQLSASQAYYIDAIEIENRTLSSDQALVALLDLDVGRVVSNEELEQAVNRLHAQDIFSRITYVIEQQEGANILHLDVSEKSWGPGYLNFKFAFEDDFANRSDFSFGAQYIYTDLTDRGGEWKFEWQIGSWKEVKTELYFPLDYQQKYFTALGLGWNSEIRTFNIIDDPRLVAESGISALNIDVEYKRANVFAETGWNVKPWSVMKLGFRGQSGDASLLLDDAQEDYEAYGPYLAYTHDNLDNFYFPSSGWGFDMELGYNRTRSTFIDDSVDDETYYYSARVMKPFSYQRHTVVALAKTAGSDSDELIPVYIQDLGGLFNLSGYHRFELNGRYSAFGAMVYRYRLLDNDFGVFSSPVFIGGSLERGGVWNTDSEVSWDSSISAASVYIGIDSLLGPLYLGYGQAEGGKSSFYLSLGSSGFD